MNWELDQEAMLDLQASPTRSAGFEHHVLFPCRRSGFSTLRHRFSCLKSEGPRREEDSFQEVHIASAFIVHASMMLWVGSPPAKSGIKGISRSPNIDFHFSIISCGHCQ